MTKKRKKYTAEFKFQVGLAALKGDKTVSEVAQEFQVHANLVTLWKKKIQSDGANLFEKHAGGDDSEDVDVDALYMKIGQLEMERDFLASRPGIIAALQKGKR